MTIESAGSGLSRSCSEPSKRFSILLEIRSGVVVNLVFLQKSIHLHSCFKSK